MKYIFLKTAIKSICARYFCTNNKNIEKCAMLRCTKMKLKKEFDAYDKIIDVSFEYVMSLNEIDILLRKRNRL